MTAVRIDGQAVNGPRKKLAESLPLSLPYSVSVFPFYGCNFRCEYCIHSMERKDRPQVCDITEMSMDVFTHFVDGLQCTGGKIKALHFAGSGEPLLHPRIVEMVRYANEKRIANVVDIVTNGALLTKELAMSLRDAGLNKIRISLQGLDRESYRKMCGVSLDFEKFYQKIYEISKNKGDMSIYIKILDKALGTHTEDEFIELFSKIADHIAVERLCPFVADIDYRDKFQQENFSNTMNSNPVIDANVCPQPFYTLDLYPDGNMVPCCNFEKPLTVGNVMESTVQEIFQGETLKRFRILQLRKEKNKNLACSRCQIYKYQMFPEDYLDDSAETLLNLYEKE